MSTTATGNLSHGDSVSDASVIGEKVSIEVRVPGLLRDCTDHQARFYIQAATLSQAVEQLLIAYPRLRVHLYDEQGRQRRHILLFYNQINFKDLDNLDTPLASGDRLSVVQAVSGG